MKIFHHFRFMKKIITISYMLVFAIIANTVKAQNQPTTKIQVSSESKNISQVPKHRIIMQLTTSDTLAHKSTLKQIHNLKEGWGQNVEIELVCHGPGLNLLRKSTSRLEKQLLNLKEKGVVIYACENTLKERNIPREDIFAEFNFVKMGIGEIVEKQEQGWSYIKAGF